MAECIFIYVTVETEVEAEKIGRALVEERLAACINIIPGMRSIYRWQGKLEQGQRGCLDCEVAGGSVRDHRSAR